jgi:hypothetical protein
MIMDFEPDALTCMQDVVRRLSLRPIMSLQILVKGRWMADRSLPRA